MMRRFNCLHVAMCSLLFAVSSPSFAHSEATGPAGPTGPHGGPTGPTGVQGISQGHTGPQGITGPTGPCCTGPTGSTGSTGAQGSSDNLNHFASLSLQNTTPGGLSIPVNTPVVFAPPDLLQGNMMYNAVSGLLTLNDVGYYDVDFGFAGAPPNVIFALQLNGNTITQTKLNTNLQNFMMKMSLTIQTTKPFSTLQVQNLGAGSLSPSSTGGTTVGFLVVRRI